ncbi:MAG TPA: phosphoribosyltransferase family protein [Candidatus Dormibacteraeota bacterium]|nr:phosphoribosyltransferase family protein [Candidatus Dormibacteraeota bacterium]
MFASREEAGVQLGHFLMAEGAHADLVAGLPRGGVIVAAETARVLGLPLDVMVVRKIGHPLHREFAVGAMAEEDVVVLDPSVAGRNPLIRSELDRIIVEERERLETYKRAFHGVGLIPFEGKAVLLIDDGLATGATMEAAVLAARKRHASRVIVSAPVGSDGAVQRLSRVADEVRIMLVDPDFDAVGRYYREFSQTTDEEVQTALRSMARTVP